MNLEPTSEQMSQLDNLPSGKHALVNFMAYPDQDIFDSFRSATRHKVIEYQGIRTHEVHIDQILARGETPYRAITEDLFSGIVPLVNVFTAVHDERQASLSDLYTVKVRPTKKPSRITKYLGFLTHLLSRLLVPGQKDLCLKLVNTPTLLQVLSRKRLLNSVNIARPPRFT